MIVTLINPKPKEVAIRDMFDTLSSLNAVMMLRVKVAIKKLLM